MEITLDQLLASREERASFQKELLKSYPGKTLVCLTVIMPGKVKRNLQSLVVAQAAVTAMVSAFGDTVQKLVLRDRQTGYEAYLETTLSNEEAKLTTATLRIPILSVAFSTWMSLTLTGFPYPENRSGRVRGSVLSVTMKHAIACVTALIP